jgi:hypothetical protein
MCSIASAPVLAMAPAELTVRRTVTRGGQVLAKSQ